MRGRRLGNVQFALMIDEKLVRRDIRDLQGNIEYPIWDQCIAHCDIDSASPEVPDDTEL